MKYFLKGFLLLVFLVVCATFATAGPIKIYLFEKTGCPNCDIMKRHLEQLDRDIGNIEIIRYNLTSDKDANELFFLITGKLEIESAMVPLVLVGEYYYVGSRQNVREELTYIVSSYKLKPYRDYMGSLIDGDLEVLEGFTSTPVDLVRLPLIGDIRLDGFPLWASTALIAFVDGFNPCSLWVLTLVLGMALHAGKRLRVLVLGIVFLLITSLVYGGFLFGAVKVVSVLRFSAFFRVLLMLFTGLFAIVAIKDYFAFGRGISFSISKGGKNAVIHGLRSLLDPSRRLPVLIAGTVLLAGLAALIELPCTAGFPVLWAQILNRFDLSPGQIWAPLALYLVIYLLDEIIILAVSVISLHRLAMNESRARYLKLGSGTLLASITLHLAFFPSVLQRPRGILSVAVLALVSSVVCVIAGKRMEVKPR